MAKITRLTRIGAYGRPPEEDPSAWRFEYAEGEASIHASNDHSAFVGKTFTLRVGGKHLRMQAAVVTLISPTDGWIEGFVEVDANGEAVDDVDGAHTGLFQREMWSW